MQLITRRQTAQISNYMYEAQCERDTNSPVKNVGVREWICYANSLCQQRQQHAASFIASARGGESFSLSNKGSTIAGAEATANSLVIGMLAKQLTLFCFHFKGLLTQNWKFCRHVVVNAYSLGSKQEIFWRMATYSFLHTMTMKVDGVPHV